MPVQITPESALGRELAKWEQHRTRVVDDELGPGNPYVYRPYPRMLYRAQREQRTGKILAVQSPPSEYQFQDMNAYMHACNAVDTFNRNCQKVVESADEERIAKNDGWSNTPDQAVAAAHDRDKSIGNAAAERHYSDRNLSDAARAEATLVDAELEGHQPVVTPALVTEAKEERKKRG